MIHGKFLDLCPNMTTNIYKYRDNLSDIASHRDGFALIDFE